MREFASDSINYNLTRKLASQSKSKLAAEDIHVLQNSPNHGIYGRHSQGKVGQRFSAQFRFSLPISEPLSQIFRLFLLFLRGLHCVAFTPHGPSTNSHGGALSGCGPDVLDPLLLVIAVEEACIQQAKVFC